MHGLMDAYQEIIGRAGQTVQLQRVCAWLLEGQLRTGEVKLQTRSGDFGRWLLCDGRSLNRVTYSELFGVLGTTFGSADPETFKLPDFRGRVLGQPGRGPGLTERSLGAAVGVEACALREAELPSHRHTGTTASGGSHAHAATSSPQGSHTHAVSDPGHAHSQNTINDDFNNSGGTGPSFSADSSGSRTWNNIVSSTTGVTVQAAGDHSHVIVIQPDGAHSHTFETEPCGSGLPHDNMQPTLFGVYAFVFAGSRAPWIRW
jgi:microcystin-dependent protein